MSKFYITTTLPYVNAEPHLGFAMEIVQADITARFRKLMGDEVIFNTGTDEHGLKIYQAALKQGKEPQSYTNEYAVKFDNLKNALNLSYTNFIRTTDPDHKKAAQEFWNRCHQAGDIYKQLYKVKYCIGCELEKTDSELIEGKCPIHPNLDIETIEEENYFFKWSKYQQQLLDLYRNNPEFVLPDYRLKEIKQFVESGLNDFSISRLKTKMPWGIPVPEDPDHVMYVWFDALVNYISTLGWPEDEKRFKEFWPGIQMAGKDNLRQQSAMWQAMLMSANISPSKQILIHGFITSGGQKMSKSLGNVINPFDLVAKYGTDAVRFFIAKELNTFDDSDVTFDRIHESYTANLANGLGNLVSRIAKLAENNNKIGNTEKQEVSKSVKVSLENYQFNEALNYVWEKVSTLDQKLNEWEPWKNEIGQLEWAILINGVRQIGTDLQCFLPETSEKILDQFSGPIKSHSPLFPRI